MASQTAGINIDAKATAIKDGRSTQASLPANFQFADGTSANQANKTYYSKQTIAYASTPVNLDFVGGGLIDLNGDTISWAEMVFLAVKTDTLNAVNVLVGGHANPIDFGIGSNTMFAKPNEYKILICTPTDPAYPLTGGSADALKLAIASGTNQSIEIFAIGRDA